MTDILQLAIIELIKYSVPRAADVALEQLKTLRTQLDLQTDESDGQSFPTAALLGLGQCGTNVCLAVAEQLRRARDKKTETKPGSVFGALQGVVSFRARDSPCRPGSGAGAECHPLEAAVDLPAMSVGRFGLATPRWRRERAAGRPVHDPSRAQSSI
jgi:hypothetical protein